MIIDWNSGLTMQYNGYISVGYIMNYSTILALVTDVIMNTIDASDWVGNMGGRML